MQTREYGDLFSLISNMIGAVTLAADEQTQVANFINRRYFEAFQESPVWPRYVVTGEERDIAVYNISGVTGADADKVNGNYALVGLSNGVGGDNGSKDGSKIYVKIENHNKATLVGSGIYQESDNAFVITGDDFDLSYNSSTDRYSITETGTVRFSAQASDDTELEDVLSWTAGTGVSGQPSIKVVQMIPYEQPNRTNIGIPLRVNRKKAFLNNSEIEY